MHIAFIGGGNMATAMIGGLIETGFAPQDIRVVERNEAARQTLAERHGVTVLSPGDAQAVVDADIVVFAVKPQDLRGAAQALAPGLARALVVSIAAGVRAADLARWLGGHRQVVRAMPNTPALVRAGVTGAYASSEVTGEARLEAERVLAAVGRVLWFEDESLLDAVTAVSGSGPAYVFYFMEAMVAAGCAEGLKPEVARELVLATVAGAARLAEISREDFAELTARVTSKGGTTERALAVFEEAGLKEILARAVRAAASRARELGDALGADAP